MLNYLLTEFGSTTNTNDRRPGLAQAWKLCPALCALALLAMVAGCATQPARSPVRANVSSGCRDK